MITETLVVKNFNFTNSSIQVAKMKSRKAKTVEEIAMAERERERLKDELDEAEDQVCMYLHYYILKDCPHGIWIKSHLS